jgi:hypothetical protein
MEEEGQEKVAGAVEKMEEGQEKVAGAVEKMEEEGQEKVASAVEKMEEEGQEKVAGAVEKMEEEGQEKVTNSNADCPPDGASAGDGKVKEEVDELEGKVKMETKDEDEDMEEVLDLPNPSEVATVIESELYKLHGGSVSKEYKAKLRSLVSRIWVVR